MRRVSFFLTIGMLTMMRKSMRVFAFVASSSSPQLLKSSVLCSAKKATFSQDSKQTNPLLQDWSKSSSYHLPPFEIIDPSHFNEAFGQSMREHKNELELIAATNSPDFDSVIKHYDRSGWLFQRVQQVYSNLCSSANPPELQAVQTTMAPVLSRHFSDCFRIPGLFDKVKAVYQEKNSMDLTPVQSRLVDRIFMDFVRAGAALSDEQQSRLADIKAALASLTTQFTQNVLVDEEETFFVFDEEDMKGCPDSLMQAAKAAAVERNHPDSFIITLGRSLVEPFLTYSDRRDLREKAFKAWTQRGSLSPDRDNASIAVEILKLRKELANIHGYSTFADYQCADRMAKSPDKVMELLENVWERSKVAAQREQKEMESFLAERGEELEGGIKAHDWRYYAEKVRKAKYDFDQSTLKPYLALESVRESMFAVSNKLFGLRYKKVDVRTYHPDVEVYEVLKKNGDLVSLFLCDNFSRPHKSGGAWMSELRGQTRNLPDFASPSERVPVICNNNNLAKGTGTTLLSPDDAKTMFHEFGHAHHGMLSESPYGRLAGTNVMTDFVELPSQLMEHWLSYAYENARHVETGEPIPAELLDKLKQTETFQQGFATVEYTACALMDMALHMQTDYNDFDLNDFENKELERLGMPEAIVMRHRPTHFQHLFSTSMYAAGYYVYQWAEVLEADAFALFEERNDIFDPESSELMRKLIYSSGNTRAPDELFREFRGRDPEIKYMLQNKGMFTEEAKVCEAMD